MKTFLIAVKDRIVAAVKAAVAAVVGKVKAWIASKLA